MSFSPPHQRQWHPSRAEPDARPGRGHRLVRLGRTYCQIRDLDRSATRGSTRGLTVREHLGCGNHLQGEASQSVHVFFCEHPLAALTRTAVLERKRCAARTTSMSPPRWGNGNCRALVLVATSRALRAGAHAARPHEGLCWKFGCSCASEATRRRPPSALPGMQRRSFQGSAAAATQQEPARARFASTCRFFGGRRPQRTIISS